MTPPDYRMPRKKEQELKSLLSEAHHQICELKSDSSGLLRIEELERDNARLAAKLASTEKDLRAYRSKNATLTSKNKELRELAGCAKKEIASLRMDVKAAHSYWCELKRKLDTTEKKRYLWAECARRLARELTTAKAETKKLKALLNRNPENSSLPPSFDANHKKIHNSRIKTGRRPGGQPGHKGHPRRMREVDCS